MNMTKVAICFIGTSKYINFFPAWHQHVQANLFPGVDKTSFVFTDADMPEQPDVRVYHTDHIKWPYITLYRFHIIQKALTELKLYDYFLFLDADMLVVSEVDLHEVFDPETPFTGVMHPYQPFGSLEFRPQSLACMEGQDMSVYFQGCLWGGRMIPEVYDMLFELSDRVTKDECNNIMAIYHDESHLNRYYSERRHLVKVLPEQFAYPGDQMSYPGPARILHQTKDHSHFHNL
jgi:Glycosyltransferase family 6